MSRRAAVYAFVGVLAASHVAMADESTARAAALFEEGTRLAASGKVAEACKKFEESEALDKRSGTLMNVAVCRDHAEKHASAWAAYTEAVAIATANDTWVAAAKKRADELKAGLGFLTIDVADDARADDLTVTLDGAKVGAAAWGTKSAVEPGAHVVGASAPGRRAWHSAMSIEAGGDKRVGVPKLEADLAAPATATVVGPSAPAGPVAPTEEPPSAWQRSTGIAGMAVGAAGLGVGGVFGILAIGSQNALATACPTGLQPCHPTGGTASAADASARGKTEATVSTIGFVAGGVLAAAGAILFFTAPDSTARVGLGGGAGRASLTFDAHF